MKENNIPKIPADKFCFVGDETRLHDQKMDTKQVSYFRDAFNRFCKNKSSVTAAIIILILILFAILVPAFCQNSYTLALNDNDRLYYVNLTPRNELCVALGLDFWDGCEVKSGTKEQYYLAYQAIGVETGTQVVKKATYLGQDENGRAMYDLRVDTYLMKGFTSDTLTPEEYQDIQRWQNETGIQVLYPVVDKDQLAQSNKENANVWYKTDKRGAAVLDANGNYTNIYRLKGRDSYDSIRIAGDPGIEDPSSSSRYRYARAVGTSDAPSYECRIFLPTYFEYKYGFEPSFLFGTTELGYDLLTRLAKAAQFSLLLAICVSAINLFIGAIYGAIEGYYGGAIDMLMERFTDILARIPFMVVATLFQLHLAKQVGPVISLLFAFVLTGWIGMASTVRMQFYRFKGQEYVLAARVLGASDWRIMFRHIFPNSLGTIITSSVLVIPGVIFSESSLTYLGIVNLDSAEMTSVGTMLANGRQSMQSYPHIIFFPALFISLLMICFNLFGNGLRDAFNPSLRGADD